MIRRLIGEDIDLRLVLADQPYLVEVDPAQIDQIIVNLAVNARDAMAKGGLLEISVGSTVLDEADCREVSGVEPGPFVWISVTDDGHGMNQETADHIFEPFFTTKEYGKGTGLGLPIVYGVVKQYRGIIKVQSAPDEGTTVRIYLPQADGSLNDPVTEARIAPSTGDETILLVEDEDAVRALTRKILASRGYKVLAAETTEDALKICREHEGPIGLLLTDVIMPHCNGQELYYQIRDIRPSIKVLYMSGYAADVIAKHGVLEKDVTFVSKPFNVDTLIAKVRESLDHEVSA
jgi:CheY-like chemotaxis protein